MKINEKTLFEFARSRPVDREGFLNKRGEVNKSFQRRWFVLKGNLLFYYEKRGNPEPLGMVILEGCLVELCEYEEERFCFSLNFPGNRRYVLAAENQESMEGWMKSLTTAGYDYMRLMISELQRQLAELDSNSSQTEEQEEQSISRPPRRQNPFNRDLPTSLQPPFTTQQQQQTQKTHPQVPLRPAPPPPIVRDTMAIHIKDDNELLLLFGQKPSQNDNDDFNFRAVHEYLGKSWKEVIKSREEAKAKTEQPLIVL